MLYDAKGSYSVFPQRFNPSFHLNMTHGMPSNGCHDDASYDEYWDPKIDNC